MNHKAYVCKEHFEKWISENNDLSSSQQLFTSTPYLIIGNHHNRSLRPPIMYHPNGSFRQEDGDFANSICEISLLLKIQFLPSETVFDPLTGIYPPWEVFSQVVEFDVVFAKQSQVSTLMASARLLKSGKFVTIRSKNKSTMVFKTARYPHFLSATKVIL